MCGFVGFTNKINDASIVLGKMMDRIKHRGPDSDGKYVDEQIAMGFRRLSIIDLSDQGSRVPRAGRTGRGGRRPPGRSLPPSRQGKGNLQTTCERT